MTFCDHSQPHPLSFCEDEEQVQTPSHSSCYIISCRLSSSVVNIALMHTTGHEELKEGGRHSKMQGAASFSHLLGVYLYYPAQSHMLSGH